jgi:hypothetical protein
MRPGSLFSGLFQPSADEQSDLFSVARARAPENPREAEDARAGRLFEGGPPTLLLTQLGLVRPGVPSSALRMLLVVLVGWLPLLVLTAIRSALSGDASISSFIADFGVHARSLIAAPLLIAADAYSLPRLSAIARHFPESGLIGPEDAQKFTYAARSTVHLRESTRLEIALFAIAATILVTLAFQLPAHIYPYWQMAGTRIGMTPAALWHEFVSVPLLAILVLGWFWRLFLWTRFLVLVSRLELKLVPAHPDRAAGLGFLGLALEATALVAFAFATIVAGTVANRVIHDGASLLSFRYVVLVFVAFVAILFISPLLVFTGKLIEAWHTGVLKYGALSRSLGMQMERRWLDHSTTPETLDANDFSATTDLYSVAANVYRLLPVPLALRDLIVLVLATLLPFVPILFFFMSLRDIVFKLTGAHV